MNNRYPIGEYEPQPFSEMQKEKWLLDLQFLPQDVEHALLNLDEAHLNEPYRTGGWSIQQLVHHIADSHLNAYLRFKLGLTEDNPTIKPYLQDEWVKLNDIHSVPINVSTTILHGIHLRLHATIKSLSEEQWQRTIVHPDKEKPITLWHLLGMYVWHGKHHVAQINTWKEKFFQQ